MFTGLGIVGTSIVGIIGLGESVSIVKIVSIAVLMIGVIGLKYCDARETAQKAAVIANSIKRAKQPVPLGESNTAVDTHGEKSSKKTCRKGDA